MEDRGAGQGSHGAPWRATALLLGYQGLPTLPAALNRPFCKTEAWGGERTGLCVILYAAAELDLNLQLQSGAFLSRNFRTCEVAGSRDGSPVPYTGLVTRWCLS